MAKSKKSLASISVLVAAVALFILCQCVVGHPKPNNCDKEDVSKPIFLQLSDNEVALNVDPASEKIPVDDGATETNRPSQIFKKVQAIMVKNHIIQDMNKEFADIFSKAKYTSKQIANKLSKVTADIQSKISNAINKTHFRRSFESSGETFDTKENGCKPESSETEILTYDLVLFHENMTDDDLSEYDEHGVDHLQVYDQISKVLNVTVEYVKRHPYLVVDILIIVAPYDYVLIRLLGDVGFTYLKLGRWIPSFIKDPFIRFIRFLGFSHPGIVKGSLAARWMSKFNGYVPAGSRFSVLQSLGAKFSKLLH